MACHPKFRLGIGNWLYLPWSVGHEPLSRSCTKHTDSNIYSLQGKQVYIASFFVLFFQFVNLRTLSSHFNFPLWWTAWRFKTLFLAERTEKWSENAWNLHEKVIILMRGFIIHVKPMEAQHFHQFHRSDKVEEGDQFPARLTTSPGVLLTKSQN